MADVRSLLRNERAQRRINHPQATYTATGTLECSVCHIPLKSNQEVWDQHLKSTQHAMRAERLRLSTPRRPERAVSTREVNGSSRKRKADDGGDDSRKKTRPVVDVPGGFFDEMIEANNENTKTQVEAVTPSTAPEPAMPPISDVSPSTLSSHPALKPTADPAIDEDEWAAFERDVATPPPDPSLPSAFTAEATISAAPLTAAQIAAQSREQASQQLKEKREAEVEGEKEDAARALEEEFDEMEGLEERVARLRRMREELRVRRAKVAEGDAKAQRVSGELNERDKLGEGSDEEESDVEEEELYGWGIMGR